MAEHHSHWRAAVHIVIMGCGRVGSTLAHILEEQGHSVAIIDQDREAFLKLRSGFRGKRITGVAGALKNMQLQRAIRGISGVQVDGQPKLENGVLTVTLRHPHDLDVTDALTGLAGSTLSFEGMPAAGVLEFAAA